LVNDGLWHHVVGVCDEANGHIYLYMDGALLASATIPAGSGLLASTTPLSIGARQSGNFNGTNYDCPVVCECGRCGGLQQGLERRPGADALFACQVFPPVITGLQPSSNWTTNQAANVVFTVAATGTAPLSYQWNG
jgi:hypothetical protein